MQTCRTKETNKCFYLTKDNRDEFLKECFPYLYGGIDNDYKYLTDFGNYFTIFDCKGYNTTFYYNCWYVEEFERRDYGFNKYTEEEFNENYELVEKEI